MGAVPYQALPLLQFFAHNVHAEAKSKGRERESLGTMLNLLYHFVQQAYITVNIIIMIYCVCTPNMESLTCMIDIRCMSFYTWSAGWVLSRGRR